MWPTPNFSIPNSYRTQAAKEQRDMSKHSNVRRHSQAGEWLIGTARRNPEALLLLAAGCALLMRIRRSSSSRSAIEQQDYRSHTAAEHVSNIGNRVSETAGDYAESVSRFAQETGRNISEQSDRFMRKAQSTFKEGLGRVLRKQPLAVALAGLAGGAAIAAAFPRTDIENRTLGPARDALTKGAAKAGENLMGAATERLQSGAAEAVKNLASDVAGTLASGVTRKSDDHGSAATVPQSPVSGTGAASESIRPDAGQADANVEPRGKDA
jgi:hypothetical protein